ncbi:hypothetical protein A4G99_03115 [Haladaptatus sp. R4]|uniref:caspase family protein n=1 Tax=Haladaptatus sp. R4 TaxID=1679489 RepID=UPI0007B4ABE0|nr:caspase family protein [Haladaptatus sp. R4]KZN25491.1 hypothetical protein A4G99_03115 [Haladaptatus sp. R4]
MSDVPVSDTVGTSVQPLFQLRDDPVGLTIIDPLERSQYSIGTTRPVTPQPVPVEEFDAPVGAVARIRTDRIEFPFVISAYVRDESGELIAAVDYEKEVTLPSSEYYIELTTKVKTYLRVESSVTFELRGDEFHISFGDEVAVEIGARSDHTRPAGTVTTTTDPADVMAAVSTFGSALKTFSPERSFPTLRGHPPVVEFGDELRIPDDLQPPETGITIEVPPEYEFVFPVVPLAYYLGATVVPGETPRIVTNRGIHSLDHPERGFEGEVARVLKQTLFLDCLTRTEGLYRVELHEREQVGSMLDLDFAALYDASLAEQLDAYLDVPFSLIEDELPTWRLTLQLTAEAKNVAQLPYVLRDLPVIDVKTRSREAKSAVASPTAINEFTRTTETNPTYPSSPVPNERYVLPSDTDTLEHAWLGDGAPVGGNKLLPSGFEHRLDREESADDAKITIVCNDPKMRAEYQDTLYGNRDRLPFDVTVEQNCSTAELRNHLREPTDFFHYIGHVENEAFVCHDGLLHPADVGDIGVDMFLLNACRSYVPGKRLVEAGSVGGIVTYSEIGNAGATVIGRTIARLLNAGFPLRAALSIAKRRRLVGNQYVVVGDGGIQVVQSESAPTIFFVEPLGGDEYEFRMRMFPTSRNPIGSFAMPFIDGVERYFLVGGDLPTFTLTGDELQRCFGLAETPVMYDDEMRWSSEIDVRRDLS